MYKKTGWGFAFTALLVAGALYSISTIHDRDEIKYGIDLQGGTELVYELDVASAGVASGEVAQTVKDIIANRLDVYGLKELSIATLGNDRLVIQIPGVSDVASIKSQIEDSGVMEFVIEANRNESSGQLGTLLREVSQYNCPPPLLPQYITRPVKECV